MTQPKTPLWQILATYVLRGRWQAAGAALLLTMVPFFSWLGLSVMALVTLRQGPKSGAWVLAWLSVPAIVFGFAGMPDLFLYRVLGANVFVWVLASVLREMGDWRSVLCVAGALSVAAVVGVHCWHPDITAWWSEQVRHDFQSLSQHVFHQSASSQLLSAAEQLSRIATGLQLALLLSGNLFALFVARYWQAALFNPGGLKKECYALRFSPAVIAVFAALFAGAVLGVAPLLDAVPVLLLPLVCAGLSMMHALFAFRRHPKLAVSVFYVLAVVFFRYAVIGLALVACLDSFFDFRGRRNHGKEV